MRTGRAHSETADAVYIEIGHTRFGWWSKAFKPRFRGHKDLWCPKGSWSITIGRIAIARYTGVLRSKT